MPNDKPRRIGVYATHFQWEWFLVFLAAFVTGFHCHWLPGCSAVVPCVSIPQRISQNACNTSCRVCFKIVMWVELMEFVKPEPIKLQERSMRSGFLLFASVAFGHTWSQCSCCSAWTSQSLEQVHNLIQQTLLPFGSFLPAICGIEDG